MYKDRDICPRNVSVRYGKKDQEALVQKVGDECAPDYQFMDSERQSKFEALRFPV